MRKCLFSRFLQKVVFPIAELQWLEQAWDHGNWFQSKVVPASQGKFIYLQTEL